jgi:uncharacterized protein YjbI with pentapeptide repeats
MAEPQVVQGLRTCTAEGCTGAIIKGQELCLAHVDEQVRAEFIAALKPGASLDLRGTTISAELLARLIKALTGEDGVPLLGRARFDGTRFDGDVVFTGARFSRGVRFGGAHFSGAAFFNSVHFTSTAEFAAAHFGGAAFFTGTRFDNFAEFDEARFGRSVRFDEAQFGGVTSFDEAEIRGEAPFAQAQVKKDLTFRDTSFDVGKLGPLLVGSSLVLRGARFHQSVLIEVVTPRLSCALTIFEGTATLRVRWAEVVLDGAVFSQPSTLSSDETFKGVLPDWGDEALISQSTLRIARQDPKPRLLSLRGVDVRNLVLSDVDLGFCIFQGAHHLDQLRIEGPRPFLGTPNGWKWGRVGGQGPPLWRWTSRQTLEEEREWRAARTLRIGPNGRLHPQVRDWLTIPPASLEWLEARTRQPIRRLGPDHVATLYRALRKAQEDSKNEPGAADFYYGEMEMRRLAPETPRSERVILTLYWLVSGYGLRGLRALFSLLVLVIAMAILFHWIGFSGDPPEPWFWGSVLYAGKMTLSIPSQEKLTAWGEVLRIVLRLTGPLLLALTLLSVRNRVKR